MSPLRGSSASRPSSSPSSSTTSSNASSGANGSPSSSHVTCASQPPGREHPERLAQRRAAIRDQLHHERRQREVEGAVGERDRLGEAGVPLEAGRDIGRQACARPRRGRPRASPASRRARRSSPRASGWPPTASACRCRPRHRARAPATARPSRAIHGIQQQLRRPVPARAPTSARSGPPSGRSARRSWPSAPWCHLRPPGHGRIGPSGPRRGDSGRCRRQAAACHASLAWGRRPSHAADPAGRSRDAR